MEAFKTSVAGTLGYFYSGLRAMSLACTRRVGSSHRLVQNESKEAAYGRPCR